MTNSLDFRVEWLNAPGVTTPELAATWARYELWLATRCVTQVEAADGTFRRGVYGSLYPLAYWIAANWWGLTSHVRPSAIDTRYWTWRNAGIYPWLRHHNFRAAGDGMPWPDLTVVPEGTVTRLVWRQDYQHQAAPVRFASDGWQLLKNSDVQIEMAAIVSVVLDRLAESGLPKTPLAEEWSAIAQVDADEREFCETAARMGLDPCSVEDETADVIVRTAGGLPPEIAGDFFDSADVSALAGAADWARRAIGVAGRATAKARQTIEAFQEASVGQRVSAAEMAENEKPWLAGYELARMLRHQLGIMDTDQFDVSPWVGVGNVSGPSHGIQGLAIVSADRCGVVLGDQYSGTTTRRFGQARALGRILARPGQRQFALSAARSQDEKVARAFAAELLAPAAGIRSALDALGGADDTAMEAVAHRFQVSPLLIRHQYDNQLASSTRRSTW
jgi:hypothetical protein